MRRRGALSIRLAAVFVAGCGGNSAKTTSTSGLEKTTITVASLPLLDAAGVHIAVSRKLFEAEGLQVKIEPVARSIDQEQCSKPVRRRRMAIVSRNQ